MQISAENGLGSEMGTFHAIFTHLSSLTVLEVERDFGKNSLQWKQSRYGSELCRFYNGYNEKLTAGHRLQLKVKNGDSEI